MCDSYFLIIWDLAARGAVRPGRAPRLQRPPVFLLGGGAAGCAVDPLCCMLYAVCCGIRMLNWKATVRAQDAEDNMLCTVLVRICRVCAPRAGPASRGGGEFSTLSAPPSSLYYAGGSGRATAALYSGGSGSGEGLSGVGGSLAAGSSGRAGPCARLRRRSLTNDSAHGQDERPAASPIEVCQFSALWQYGFSGHRAAPRAASELHSHVSTASF